MCGQEGGVIGPLPPKGKDKNMLADTKEKQITWEDLEVAEEVNPVVSDTLNLKPRIILSWEHDSSVNWPTIPVVTKDAIIGIDSGEEDKTGILIVDFEESVSFSLNDYEFLVGMCTPSRVYITGNCT